MFGQAICPLNFPMGLLWELTDTLTAKTYRNDGKTRIITSKYATKYELFPHF